MIIYSSGSFFLVRCSLLCLSLDWEIHQCTAGQFGDQSKPNSWICAQANMRKGVGVLPCPHIHSPSATQLISKSWLLISKPCLAFCHYDIYWCSHSFFYYSVIIWASINIYIMGFSQETVLKKIVLHWSLPCGTRTQARGWYSYHMNCFIPDIW